MSDSDSWETPQWLFDQLNAEFHFDIDLCATEDNSKCEDFCHDYLNDIIGRKGSNCIGCFQQETKQGLIQSAFMNPPYSRPTKTNPGINSFIEKAWEDSKYCKIVCLVKCDPSTKWWSTFWNYDNSTCTNCSSGYPDNNCYCEEIGPKPGCEVRFLPRRIRFEAPPGLDGQSGPTFPSCIVIMDRRRL